MFNGENEWDCYFCLLFSIHNQWLLNSRIILKSQINLFAHGSLCLCSLRFARAGSIGCSAVVFWAIRIRCLWKQLAQIRLASFIRRPGIRKSSPAQRNTLPRRPTVRVCLGSFVFVSSLLLESAIFVRCFHAMCACVSVRLVLSLDVHQTGLISGSHPSPVQASRTSARVPPSPALWICAYRENQEVCVFKRNGSSKKMTQKTLAFTHTHVILSAVCSVFSVEYTG